MAVAAAAVTSIGRRRWTAVTWVRRNDSAARVMSTPNAATVAQQMAVPGWGHPAQSCCRRHSPAAATTVAAIVDDNHRRYRRRQPSPLSSTKTTPTRPLRRARHSPRQRRRLPAPPSRRRRRRRRLAPRADRMMASIAMARAAAATAAGPKHSHPFQRSAGEGKRPPSLPHCADRARAGVAPLPPPPLPQMLAPPAATVPAAPPAARGDVAARSIVAHPHPDPTPIAPPPPCTASHPPRWRRRGGWPTGKQYEPAPH